MAKPPPTIAFDHEWYVACTSAEVKRGRARRLELFDHAIVLWRDSSGALHALDDRCPHLSASLSLGKISDDGIQCGMHGQRYAPNGSNLEVPSLAADFKVPKALCARSWAVAEHQGWVRIFWGPADQATDVVFGFDEITDAHTNATTAHEWPVHFTRTIENQLDHAHLPFVHRNTIGLGGSYEMKVGVWLEGNSLKTRVTTQVEALDHQYSRLIYPNLWINHLHPKFIAEVAFVPVGLKRTRIYLRGHQAFVPRWAGGQLAAWLNQPINNLIFRQDASFVRSQLPINTDEARGETLLPYDAAIAAFRKLRRSKLSAQKKRLSVVQDVRTPDHSSAE
jgi:phenylpropionate dioxygenase-like ring-hydroxylating dioxygenase large terminal subunit